MTANFYNAIASREVGSPRAIAQSHAPLDGQSSCLVRSAPQSAGPGPWLYATGDQDPQDQARAGDRLPSASVSRACRRPRWRRRRRNPCRGRCRCCYCGGGSSPSRSARSWQATFHIRRRRCPRTMTMRILLLLFSSCSFSADRAGAHDGTQHDVSC